VRELIRDLRGSNRSIVLCTHDLDEAERLADEVAIIRRGRIVALGSPAGLRAEFSPDTLVRIALAAPCPAAGAVLDELGLAPLAPAPDALGVAYQTPQPQEVNPTVVARLVAAGARIVAVHCETQTLEDIYATLIGRDAAATAGEEGR
jgi:ABC-2 type transport system ATP-binding protein